MRFHNEWYAIDIKATNAKTEIIARVVIVTTQKMSGMIGPTVVLFVADSLSHGFSVCHVNVLLLNA